MNSIVRSLTRLLIQLYRRFRDWVTTRLATGDVSESALVMGTAVLVGVLTGIAALVFRSMILGINNGLYDWLGSRIQALHPIHLILIPAAGGAVVGQITLRWTHEARGPGIPEVMEAVALHRGRIRPRVALGKALAASICIGSGGSAGREGPIAQIGSALGSTVGTFLHLPSDHVKNLVACGAAGGISATFNAPIAGSLFALEVILGHFQAMYFGAVVISAVIADVVLNMFVGNERTFIVPEYAMLSPWELVLYAALGLLAGPLAVLFVRLLELSESWWQRLPVPAAAQPMLGGGLLGVLGILTFKVDGYPRIFGVGYETMTEVLFGELAVSTVLALLALKMIATAITLGSGGSGGVFAPSLFMGAMLGGAFGLIAERLFPGIAGPPGAYALVGMAAFVSGAVHTPVTIIIMLFELTGNYEIILPLMLATVMSTAASALSGHESVYTSKLSRRGVRLHRGHDLDLMQGISVQEGMSPVKATAPLDMPLLELAELFEHTHSHGFPVVDAEGLLAGAVSISDYEKALHAGPIEHLRVRDIATQQNLLVTYPDEPMSDALRRLALRDISRLPVVADPGSRRLVGIIRRSDVIRAYNQALSRGSQYQHRLDQLSLEKAGEASFDEIEVTERSLVAGKRVAELRLPQGSLLVSVRRKSRLLVVQADTIIQAGDVLTVFGSPAVVKQVRRQLSLWPISRTKAAREPRHLELIIPAGATCARTRIQDLGLPPSCLVVSIRRGDEVLVAHGDTTLVAGDIVELFGTPDDLTLAEQLLTRCT